VTLPKYVQIKRHLLSQIASGDLRADERMPSETELSGQFGVSRQTVRQALAELEHEGWLYRIQGKGTFVRGGTGVAAAGARTVGIVTTYISDYIFPAIIRGAEAVLRERGYGMMLASTDNDRNKERECLKRLSAYPLRGMIVEPTRSAEGRREITWYLELERKGVPYVMIHESYPELGCPVVKVDDEFGAFLATEHLVRLGHRRVAGMFKTDDLQGVYRLKGYLRALRQNGIAPDPDFVVRFESGDRSETPRRQAYEWLRKDAGARPTAIVCYNDEAALEVLEAVRACGMRVPDDLSVVGFDDSALAVASDVKLTTVAHPKEELGKTAAELLIRLMERPASAEPAADIGRPLREDEPLSVTFRPELVVRASTAPPPSGG